MSVVQMDNPPPAPESIPNYIADGIQKRKTPGQLKAIEEYAERCRVELERRENAEITDSDISDDEDVIDIEETGEGTVVIKKITCGKENCRCMKDGEKHGPYKYTVQRSGDSLEWEYHGPVAE